MKAALDTNILVYAEGVNDAEKKRKAWIFSRNFPTTQSFLSRRLANCFRSSYGRRASHPLTPELLFTSGATRSIWLKHLPQFCWLPPISQPASSAYGTRSFSALPPRPIAGSSSPKTCRTGLSGEESQSSILFRAPRILCWTHCSVSSSASFAHIALNEKGKPTLIGSPI